MRISHQGLAGPLRARATVCAQPSGEEPRPAHEGQPVIADRQDNGLGPPEGDQAARPFIRSVGRGEGLRHSALRTGGPGGLGGTLYPDPPYPMVLAVHFAGPWGCARGEERETRDCRFRPNLILPVNLRRDRTGEDFDPELACRLGKPALLAEDGFGSPSSS